MSIYVGNLPYDFTESQVLELFEKYGSVKRIRIPPEQELSCSKRIAIVDMKNDAEENVAIKDLHRLECGEEALIVKKAYPRVYERSYSRR